MLYKTSFNAGTEVWFLNYCYAPARNKKPQEGRKNIAPETERRGRPVQRPCLLRPAVRGMREGTPPDSPEARSFVEAIGEVDGSVISLIIGSGLIAGEHIAR